jgi:hypothetical protein
MPKVVKYKDPVEIGSFFEEKSSDSPIPAILLELSERHKLQKTLILALEQLGLSQLSNDISLGEINASGEINLLAHKATIISKLKNKLPSLLNFFRESGFPLRGVHLKVSPKLSPNLALKNTPELQLTPMSKSISNKQAWVTLSEELDADSPVRKAVTNLLKKIN